MIALHTISVFVSPETSVKCHSGTLDIEIAGDYPDDAQLQFFAVPAFYGSDTVAQYEGLRDFFHACALECEAAIANEREGAQDGATQDQSVPGLLGSGGMQLRDVR